MHSRSFSLVLEPLHKLILLYSLSPLSQQSNSNSNTPPLFPYQDLTTPPFSSISINKNSLISILEKLPPSLARFLRFLSGIEASQCSSLRLAPVDIKACFRFVPTPDLHSDPSYSFFTEEEDLLPTPLMLHHPVWAKTMRELLNLILAPFLGLGDQNEEKRRGNGNGNGNIGSIPQIPPLNGYKWCLLYEYLPAGLDWQHITNDYSPIPQASNSFNSASHSKPQELISFERFINKMMLNISVTELYTLIKDHMNYSKYVQQTGVQTMDSSHKKRKVEKKTYQSVTWRYWVCMYLYIYYIYLCVCLYISQSNIL